MEVKHKTFFEYFDFKWDSTDKCLKAVVLASKKDLQLNRALFYRA